MEYTKNRNVIKSHNDVPAQTKNYAFKSLITLIQNPLYEFLFIMFILSQHERGENVKTQLGNEK